MVITTPTAVFLPSSSYQSQRVNQGFPNQAISVDFPITPAGHTQISRDHSGPGTGFSSEKGKSIIVFWDNMDLGIPSYCKTVYFLQRSNGLSLSTQVWVIVQMDEQKGRNNHGLTTMRLLNGCRRLSVTSTKREKKPCTISTKESTLVPA